MNFPQDEEGAELDEFIKKLRAENYKLTPQRRDILKTLLKYSDRHFTAEKLHKKVQQINSDLGLATVYRNLELFCELGFIHRLDFDSDHKYYELLESHSHHHHMICLNCEKIIEFNDEDLEDFETRLEDEYDFFSVNHFIKFYGYCQKCHNGEAQNESD
ncbi:Fur family transcriptional regulator [Halarsenatibacter silvermanii]|uniref:Fur family transcriptional regulator, ferric uptake regulator n=1 Tax=Halarsenatibacter silvermanii TaxID=321763 RepID=A0A1G9K071_9FIRM|nr:Fur family transcriptional regulator [Halarsenatibacter silvermanii]SDL43169.1 Fur family transcriptional regulator, ferric uptake regulator [Halarsenatibacter silvermanii]